ncbi:MAG: hypothetical protein ACPGEG_09455 [Salibacteraceae bacterium]
MKKAVLILVTIMSCAFIGAAQTKKAIAVGNPSVTGLDISPQIAAKLMRLELIKLKTYSVYDEFDMQEIYDADSNFESGCWSKSCLTRMGEALEVDLVISGSFDALGNKIVISLKVIDIKNKLIYKSAMREFDNQEHELQRMTEIVLKEMHEVEANKVLVDRLKFNNEVISSNNVGRINNSGPRVGYSMLTGAYHEFATRSEAQGGLDIFPGVSMIGYQFEGQYVGTENFSALIEGVVNISGMEQGLFMPSISILNGFRFGTKGWEFAFGPGFGLVKESKGFFDTKGLLGEKGNYISEQDYKESEYYSENPDVSAFDPTYNFSSSHLDTRGVTKVSTSFVMAVGRTFRSGALNIPVNVFYSARKRGGFVGVSVGFNVMKTKKNINSSKRKK